MTVLVFGNADLDLDALPFRILPELRAQCPHATFHIVDPNEEFNIPNNAIIVDTVANIAEPRIFASLDTFAAPPRLSLHDFDLYSHLAFLKKLGRLPAQLNIVGLPPTMSPTDAVMFVKEVINVPSPPPTSSPGLRGTSHSPSEEGGENLVIPTSP